MTSTTSDFSNVPCNACGGTGYQYNQVTGLRVVCPVCGGSGYKYRQHIEVIC